MSGAFPHGAEVGGWIWLREMSLPDVRVGALPGEQGRGQPLEIDVGLLADLSAAARSDRLGDTLDWSGVFAQVSARVYSRHWTLVEALAVDLARHLLAGTEAQAVRCEVRKRRCLPTGYAAVIVELAAGAAAS